jgi:hypothetical protein
VRVLIRFLARGTAGAAGGVETRERWFDGDVVTLGRASDQVIYVRDRRVALEHARISRRGGTPVVTALTPAGVVLNGAVVREAVLTAGDVLQVGENLVKALEPVAGADLALSFELDPAVRAEDSGWQPAGLRLGEYLPGMRAWSWFLFVLALALTLAIPASGLLTEGWQQQLRASVLPSDGAWNPGPISSVHAVTAENCEACHQQPFVSVRDEACLGCHEPSLGAHAENFATVAATVGRSQCTDCHREHDGAVALVRADDGTCSGCHGNLKAAAGSRVSAHDASDFGSAHPEFRITNRHVTQAVRADGTRPFVITTRRELAAAPGFDDGSGLIFPHDEHLAKAGIRGPDGTRVLGCGDCHVADAAGGFRPIAMERDCGDCHRLDFDPTDPDRVVPHGQPQAAVDMLVEYYSARYLEGFGGALPLPGDRPRPGRALGADERALALSRARERAALVARDVFERRVCVTCHVVDRVGDGAWVVRPVALTEAWFPEARFDHGDHGTTLTPCATCHQAGKSADARDILMPTIADCRACHAGSDVPTGRDNLIASACMSCHGFHRPKP